MLHRKKRKKKKYIKRCYLGWPLGENITNTINPYIHFSNTGLQCGDKKMKTTKDHLPKLLMRITLGSAKGPKLMVATAHLSYRCLYTTLGFRVWGLGSTPTQRHLKSRTRQLWKVWCWHILWSCFMLDLPFTHPYS